MKKRKIMSGLLTAILSVTMMAPSFSVFAETSEAGTPKENKTAEMTVKVEGNGNLSFKDVSGKTSDETKKKPPMVLN